MQLFGSPNLVCLFFKYYFIYTYYSICFALTLCRALYKLCF